MKINYARLLHDKYFSLTDRNIEVILKNGRIMKGVIIGFFTSGEECSEPSIKRWHILEQKHESGSLPDGLGVVCGEIIDHKAIAEVHFPEDNSKMVFGRYKKKSPLSQRGSQLNLSSK